MSDSLNILVLGPEHAEAATDLVRRVFMRHVAPLFVQEGVDTFLSFAQTQALLQRMADGALLLGAQLDERLVGIIEFATNCHISFFFVETDFQGHQVGRALFRHLVGICGKCGCLQITLNSSPNAVGFYQKLGFETLDEERCRDGIRHVPMRIELLDVPHDG